MGGPTWERLNSHAENTVRYVRDESSSESDAPAEMSISWALASMLESTMRLFPFSQTAEKKSKSKTTKRKRRKSSRKAIVERTRRKAKLRAAAKAAHTVAFLRGGWEPMETAKKRDPKHL